MKRTILQRSKQVNSKHWIIIIFLWFEFRFYYYTTIILGSCNDCSCNRNLMMDLYCQRTLKWREEKKWVHCIHRHFGSIRYLLFLQPNEMKEDRFLVAWLLDGDDDDDERFKYKYAIPDSNCTMHTYYIYKTYSRRYTLRV